MKKKWYIVLIINLFPIFTYGQIDFYSTDSTTSAGIDMVNGSDINNSRFCQVQEKEKITKYSPYEVKEYGFKDGRTYKSFLIKINDTSLRYFLEKLVVGNVNLYYLKVKKGIKKYYLSGYNDNKLIELPLQKEKYSILLDSFTKDYPQALHNVPYIKLRKYCLIRFIKDYNNCKEVPFPRFQYGFKIGLNTSQLSAVKKSSIYSVPSYNKDLKISIGLFMDIPIQFSNVSFHPEIYYKHTSISKAFNNGSTNNDLVINYSSISFPLLIRYCILRNKIRPYFQLGPVYSRAIKNNGTLYQYETTENNIFINIINSPILQKDLGGFSIGSGFISEYGSKHSWFCELSYCKLYNLSLENKLLNLSEITMEIGLIF